MAATRQKSELVIGLTSYRNRISTDPIEEGATIPDLVAALRRFHVRPRVAERFHRSRQTLLDLERAWRAGEARKGRRWRKFEEAARNAAANGQRASEAIRDVRGELVEDARKKAEAELLCWSPHVLEPGARRSSDAVREMSALVLEWRDGPLLDDITAEWASWFLLIHTSWEHTTERPVFRAVVPFATPVPVDEWPAIVTWARQHSSDAIVPADPATTWTVPTVGDHDDPRIFSVNPGTFFDPDLLGLVHLSAADWPLAHTAETPPSLLRGDPDVPMIEAHPEPTSDSNGDQSVVFTSSDAPAPTETPPEPEEPSTPHPVTGWVLAMARMIEQLRLKAETEPRLLIALLEDVAEQTDLTPSEREIVRWILLGQNEPR